jgi:hypothetical protein
MILPLLDVPGFDGSTQHALALQTSGAITTLVTAGGLSLSLVAVIAIVSLDLLRAAPVVL